ncbi:MAG: hypothetical protein Alpg2KO_32710 [Alphaproteobacteria bacterium]
MQAAGKAGIATPRLLAQTDAYLVLEDAGQPLGPLLKQQSYASQRLALLLQATQTLGHLHRAGLVHGRPHVKDMTLRGGPDGPQIVLLDFEEDPLQVMSLPEAQARDVWLWLAAASRHVAAPAELDALLRAYLQDAPDDTDQALSRLARLLGPLNLVLTGMRLNALGRDLKQISAATACLVRWFRASSGQVDPL